VRAWAAQELAAGRLLPWLAVAYGAGIVLYFTAEREPVWWAAIALAAVCATCAVLLRRQFLAFVVALGLSAMSFGFAVATVKTALIAHPVLRFSASRCNSVQTPNLLGARSAVTVAAMPVARWAWHSTNLCRQARHDHPPSI